MALLPFEIDGKPNPKAALVNLVLMDSLYRESSEAVDDYAAISGSTVVVPFRKPDTLPPAYCILKNGNEYLICFAGTVNTPQWLMHLGSIWAPSIDTKVGKPVVLSFFDGEFAIEDDILAKIPFNSNSIIRVTGHSYGAAVGHIFLRRLLNGLTDPPRVELMTFGEPKAYGGRGRPDFPVHQRILEADDPVQFCPPGYAFLWRSGPVVGVAAFVFGLRWSHSGQAWSYESDGTYEQRTTIPDVYITDLVLLGFSSTVGTPLNHIIDKGYLPSMLKTNFISPGDPLFPIIQLGQRYVGSPISPDNMARDAITPTQVNDDWFPGEIPKPITSQNITSSVVISGNVSIKPFNFNGVSMAAQFKGTLDFAMDNQGFSESLYAVPGSPLVPDSYIGMQSAMKQVLNARMLLSHGLDTECPNPLVCVNIKVEDENVLRDAYVSSVQAQPTSLQFPDPLPPRTLRDNANVELCAKLSWQSGASRQKAVTYLHGLPLDYFNYGAGNPVRLGVDLRESNPNAEWIQNLEKYCNTIVANGLGFRYLTSPWDFLPPAPNAGNPGPLATPVSVVYNPTYSMYEIQMPPGSVGANTVDRYVLRGWKQFPYMNGRWPGMLVAATIAPQTGTVIRILRKARQVASLQPGFVSLQRWSYFRPSLAGPGAGLGFPGVVYYFVTSKKVGRISEVQRGRARNRPT